MMDDTQHRPASGEGEKQSGADDEFSIAQSNAIIPLLVMFGLTALVIFWIIVRSEPVVPPEGAVANVAYGPADFPQIFGPDTFLADLEKAAGKPGAQLFAVSPPPFTEGIFPCSQCHADIPPNPERRPLPEMHSDIVLHHDEQNRWCLDCHDANNRDELHLANGTLIPFTESYRLCGQCHGTQYRDWRSGVHGKRVGYWNGPKRYLLCVHCHNPHSPRFAPLKPLPPPVRPQYLHAEDAGPAGTKAEVADNAKEERAAHVR
jgi:hypothetical protein